VEPSPPTPPKASQKARANRPPSDEPLAPSDQTYLDARLKSANKAAHLARTSRHKLDRHKSHPEPTELQTYKSAVATAKQERAHAELAIQDMLGRVYRGDNANVAATRNRAHGIAARYATNPEAQALVSKALHTVTTQTPAQSNLRDKLFAVDKAYHRLARLVGKQTRNKASAHSLTAATQDLHHKREALLTVVQQDLSNNTAGGTDASAFKNANAALVALAPDDPELAASVQAADVLLSVKAELPKGSNAQLQTLGRLTPKNLAPTARALIAADPAIKTLKAAYVRQSVGAVTAAYQRAGTLAAADRLRAVTDATGKSYLSANMAARIVNQLLPTTLDKIVTDVHKGTLLGKQGAFAGGVTRAMYGKITTDISAAVQSAARGTNPATRQFDSPTIKSAIEGTGRLLAMHPALWGDPQARGGLARPGQDNGVTKDSRNVPSHVQTWDFRSSVAKGYSALAYETVHQTTSAKPGDLPAGPNPATDKTDTYDPQRAARTMLATIAKGYRDSLTEAATLHRSLVADERPLLAPGASFAPAIASALNMRGQHAVVTENPEQVGKVKQDLQRLDRLGLAISRNAFTFKGYEPLLHNVGGWTGVAEQRKTVGRDPGAFAAVVQSRASRTYQVEQSLRTAVTSAQKSGATIPGPDVLSLSAWMGVNAEYLTSINGGPIPNALKGGKVGAFPPLSVAIMGVAGGLQVAYSSTLSNASFSPDWIAPFFTTGMWAFAGKRAMTFLSAVGRIGVRGGTRRDRLTALASEQGSKLVKAIMPGVMGLWLLSDGAGTITNAMHGNFLGASASATFLGGDLLYTYDALHGVRALLGAASGRNVASAVAEKAATTAAAEGASNAADELPGIGWGLAAANALYLVGASIVSGGAVYEQNKHATVHCRQFLTAIGVSPAKSQILAAHSGFNGKFEAQGLILGYRTAGGDPAKFVRYVNSLSDEQLSSLMTAASGLAAHIDHNGKVPLTQKNADYLALPANPAAAGTNNPNIVFDKNKNRWEAPKLRMYFSKTGGTGKQPGWVYDGATPHGSPAAESYTPGTWGGTLSRLKTTSVSPTTVLAPTSKAGLQNWMTANGFPMPPQASKTPKQNPRHNKPSATLPELAEPNVQKYRQGESLDGLAGNVPAVERKLYDANPWLNPKLADGNPETRRHHHEAGRDPDLLKPGDVLVWPKGVKPPPKY